MKKIITITMLMLALVSCNNNQVGQVAGSYSYKISGKARLSNLDVVMTEEIGAMDIIRNSSDSVLLTFNTFNGPVFYTTAAVKGKNIELVPFNREVTQSLLTYGVAVSGNGTVYDGTIIFNLCYKGDILNADSLIMLCKRN